MTDVLPVPKGSQGTIIIQKFSVSEQRYKSFTQLLLIVANYALGNFYFGYCMVYLNSIQFSAVMRVYGINLDKDLALGLLVGCLPIGAGAGALGSNLLMKNYSRRKCILIVNAIAFSAGCFLFIQSFMSLLLVRLIQGFCVGAYSTLVPILIKQTTPVEASGKLGVMTQFFISLGVFFAFFFKFILSKMTGDQIGDSIWTYIFGFTLLTITLQTINVIFIYNFETPKYLIEKEQYLAARQLLQLVYKPQFVQQVYKQKLHDANKIPKCHAEQQSVQVLQVDNKNINLTNKIVSDFQIPKQGTPGKAIFLALHLGLLQQLSGVNAVVVYGGQTVGQVYSSLKSIFPMLINFIQVIAPLVLSTILSCVGRKPIMQVGTLLNIVTTAIVGTGFMLISVDFNLAAGMILMGLLLFMVNFSLTIGPLVWMYIPQIAQPKVVTIATAVNWLGATLIMFLFPIIKGKILQSNPAILFYFFSAYSFISLFINQKFIIQTKDKTQKQIRDEFIKEVRQNSTQQSSESDEAQ